MDPSEVPAARIALEVQRATAKGYIQAGPSVQESMRLTMARDDVVDEVVGHIPTLVASLNAYVLTERLYTGTAPARGKHTVITFGWSSPWQHFKHNREGSRLWGWFVRRWPPQQTATKRTCHFDGVVTCTRHAAFPQATTAIQDPSLGPPVIWEKVEFDHA